MKDAMKGSYLGPEFTDFQIKSELDACGAVYKCLSEEKLIDDVVKALADEKSYWLMQGRMEFGPRALVEEALLQIRVHQNAKAVKPKVKYRESFRPFAPSILSNDV